uniref:Putative secreted protein n=1 Tax=Ixodes ricinus TaxID=34613 RepID=A0A6B0UM21_IXORI
MGHRGVLGVLLHVAAACHLLAVRHGHRRQAVRQGTHHLDCRVRKAMGNSLDKTYGISVVDELGPACGDVVEEPHWVAEKIYSPQDLGCVALEFPLVVLNNVVHQELERLERMGLHK